MNAFNETKKFVILGILAAIAMFGIFLATRPGKWVCKDGVWIAKGRVTSAKPVTLCPIR